MLRPYKMTWRLIRKYPSYFWTIVLLVMTLKVVGQYFQVGLPVKLIPWLIILYSMHRAMLFDDVNMPNARDPGPRPVRLGRFLLVCGGIFILLMITTLFSFLLYDASTGFQSTSENRLVPLMITMLFWCFVLASLFGTTLPAVAAADDTPIAIRTKHSLRSIPRIMRGMIIGPGFYYLLFLIGLATVGEKLGLEDVYYDPQTGLNWIQTGYGFIVTMFSMVGGFLAVAVLCDAYQRLAPDHMVALMRDIQKGEAQPMAA